MEVIKSSTRPGPGRPTREASVARRENMLNIGARIICEQGYHGSSIRDIVNAVGVPKGSFYNYFPSKEEFVVEALEHHMGKRLQEFTVILEDSARSPVWRITESFRSNPDTIATDEFTPMSFLVKISTEVGGSIPVIEAMCKSLFLRFRDALVACITEAQQQGQVSPEKDRTSLATFILFAWHGAMMYSRDQDSTGSRAPFHEVLERDILI
jgi:TetR/AcrR family transcriptional repressor of nem operon